jgi:hypothetical protein
MVVVKLPFSAPAAEFNLKIELVDAGNAIAFKATTLLLEKINYFLLLLSPPAASGTFFYGENLSASESRKTRQK